MKILPLCAALMLSAAAYAHSGTAHYDVLAVTQAPDFTAPYNAQYWENIPVIAGEFHYPWRNIPVPPTTFKAVHDKDNLYMVFTAQDPNIVLQDWKDENTVAKEDRVEVFFAPSAIDRVAGKNLPDYYGLEIDPQGRVLDYKGRYYRHLDNTWNLNHLQTNGEVKDGQYIVRIKIPLEELKRLDLIKDNGSIQAGLFRAEYVPNPDKENIDKRWIAWVNPNTEQPDFHVNSAFGEFRLLPAKP